MANGKEFEFNKNRYSDFEIKMEENEIIISIDDSEYLKFYEKSILKGSFGFQIIDISNVKAILIKIIQ